MAPLHLIFVVAFLVCELIAAVWYPQPEPYRGRLMAAGLACFAASLLF